MLAIIAVILATVYYFISTYSIKTVYVEGNIHYTEEEIKEMVMDGPLGNNSLYLSFKYKNKGVEDVPFVDVMDVSVLSPDTIRITVYEKSLAGYIEFMDSYMYFDRDGYIVETSNVKTVGVPWIVGLDFDHVVLGEKIPVADDSVFASVMNITNLLNDFGLNADKIYFQSDLDIVLWFGDIRVMLGEGKNLQEKFTLISRYLNTLEGQKGVWRMEDYSQEGDIAVFEVDATKENE